MALYLVHVYCKVSHSLSNFYINLCFEAKNLGVACDIAAQCVAGDGGAGTVCDTTCKKGKLAEFVSSFCFSQPNGKKSYIANLTPCPGIF